MLSTRYWLSSSLLICLVLLCSSSLFFYGNTQLNQINIICQMLILILIGFLTEIIYDRFSVFVVLLNISSLIITMAFHRCFGVAIVFINIILACIVFNNIQIDRNAFIAVHLIPAILWSIIVFFSIKGVYNTDIGEYYWYKFLNNIYHKNTIGIISSGCIYHWLCLIDIIRCRKLYKYSISIMIMIPYFFKIIESECRSALFAIILFALLCFLIKSDIKYRNFYFLTIGFIVMSGIFTIFYVVNINKLDLGVIMGRSTENRLDVWKDAFSLIWEHPFFGSGTDIKMNLSDSAHNTVLSILKTIGLIPLVSYIVCFGRRNISNNTKPYRKVSQMAVLSSLIIAFFESFYTESYISLAFLCLLI